MNYSELQALVEDEVENSFTAVQFAGFTKQAEKMIYETAEIPAMQNSDTGPLTASTNTYTAPADYLYSYSMFIVDGSGNRTPVLSKDQSFIHAAYPNPTTEGLPKYYAQYSEDTLLFGPTPDSNYVIDHVYGAYPESIVTASTTWLGDNFDNVLFNAVLLEAHRFLQSEQDVIANTESMLSTAILLFKNMADGRLRTDAYRSGQPRKKVD